MEDLELAPLGYPDLDIPLEEKRRAWVIDELCRSEEGPIFESMVRLAKDIETFLISGTVPDTKPKFAKVPATHKADE